MLNKELKELYVAIQTAGLQGFKFVCATDFIKPLNGEFKCKECSNKYVSFVTQSLIEANTHSLRNNIPMWISFDEGKARVTGN